MKRTIRFTTVGRHGLMQERLARLAVLLGAWALTTAGFAQTPADALPADVVALQVEPTEIRLSEPFAYVQTLVTAITSDGRRIDATRAAQRSAPAGVVSVAENGLVRPVSDGQGQLVFSVGPHSASVAVEVTGVANPYAVSFVRDVQPVLSKMGCNQGTCHGGAQGKNGFQLSLRGYDPVFDHRALTDDLAGRRFNRAAPDQSLMLLKPTGGVPHVGGVVMKAGDPYYELLRAWIAQGVPFDRDSPRVASIAVFPQDLAIPMPGMQQQLRVLATFADGQVRDVSAEAHLESSQSEVVEVNKSGLATAVRRGEAAILVRYEGAYAAAPIFVMGDRTGFVWQDAPVYTEIDRLVYEKLQKIKVLPSDVCTDAEFVRRVYLDLTGLPPSPEQTRAFLSDPAESRAKRDALVDRLVGSSDYVEYWTNKWADLLQVNRKFLGDEGAWAFRNWIRQAVATNLPYDRFVNEILTAQGSNLDNPAAAYFKVLRDPGDAMENTTQLFLAVRFSCNKCHDHPFERWTQDQYYHLAAYFAQIGRKPDPSYAGRTVGGTNVEAPLPLVEVIFDQGGGEVTHARTGEIAAPQFPYQSELAHDAAARRTQLAEWVTSPDNQYFAKSYVNRVWSYLLGVGIIEPIDDIRAGNPPTNPELLTWLADEFIRTGFDVQHLFRLICKSRVYQHSLQSNEWNADDSTNYSHAVARRLPAETLYDAIHVATGSRPSLPGMPAGFRASQAVDSAVELTDGFFSLFGRPPRESACECERSTGVMLGQALNLVNGPTIANAISDPLNSVTATVNSTSDDRRVVEELFVAILCRPPTEQEIAAGLTAMSEAVAEYQTDVDALTAYEQNELPLRLAAWEQAQSEANWLPLAIETVVSAGNAAFTKLDDGSVLLGGENPPSDTLTIVCRTELSSVTGLRLEVLPDPSLGAQGPGRAPNGNFVLQELQAVAASAAQPDQATPVVFGRALSDFAQDGYPAASAIDGNPGSGWAVAPQFAQPHVAVFETQADVQGQGGVTLTLLLVQNFGGQHTIGRFRLSATNAARPLTLEGGPPPQVVQILAVPAEQRTPEQLAALREFYIAGDAELARLRAAVAAYGPGGATARLIGAQDIAWALLNSPAFLFNR